MREGARARFFFAFVFVTENFSRGKGVFVSLSIWAGGLYSCMCVCVAREH